MSGDPTLVVTGAVLLGLAVAVAGYQLWRAPCCPAHRPWAGGAAWLLAGFCAAAGAALLILDAG